MIDSNARAELERRIFEQCARGEHARAVELLLEQYGKELLMFLVARLRDREAARDVFAQFAEDAWRGLPAFRWECTARVWAYTLARHAASRHVEAARRGRQRNVPLSHAAHVAEQARTRTLARTDTRNRIAALRERLPVDDQSLLLLRVNRKLEWKEIARILSANDADDASLTREAMRLRKRYQLVKERLRRMAIQEGLVRIEDAP